MKKNRFSFSLALLVAVVSSAACAGPLPLKAPFIASNTRVNTTTPGLQGKAAVTHLRDGGWLVTWKNRGLDGLNAYNYQQRYAPSGIKVGMETQVSTTMTEDERSPVVTGLADGGWVVAWMNYARDGADSGVYQQRYDVSGAKVGVKAHVNTVEPGRQGDPAVTALGDGGWVVTWMSDAQDGADPGVFQQRYAVSGANVGVQKQVNTTGTDSQHFSGATALVNTTETAYQVSPAVTALADDGWVVAWQSYDHLGSNSNVYQQRYAASGDTVGGETLVNTTTTQYQVYPAVTALADDGWVVAWQSDSQDDSSLDVYQQRYTASGAKEGGETVINTTTTGHQAFPAVAALAGDGWVVTWTSDDDEGRNNRVCQQRYAASGAKVGSEMLVNTTTAKDQSRSAVTALVGGGWLVTWASSSGIYQQRYDVAGNPVGN